MVALDTTGVYHNDDDKQILMINNPGSPENMVGDPNQLTEYHRNFGAPRDNQEDESMEKPFEPLKPGKSGIRLEWHDLCVSIKQHQPGLCARLCRQKKDKNDEEASLGSVPILKGVNGVAESGTLVAIMGASGAGKTTMLNVLSRQLHKGMITKGTVLVNNKNIGRKIKSVSAYVQQEDIFIGTLTVKEHLNFQANLRMDPAYSAEEKYQRVDDVITQLGLTKCQDTIIGVSGRVRGISGGELKRLSFASELIVNPKLLFVDEPTSGLDSFMAENVVMALRNLAREGRTVLTTIHQPSSSIFRSFDRLILLSEGRTAFQGLTEDAGKFFASCGFPTPANYNPADHFIECLAIVPGREEECRERCRMVIDSFAAKSSTGENQPSLDHINIEIDMIAGTKYQQGFFTQLSMLLGRSLKQFKRDPLISRIRIMQAVCTSLIVGLIFLNQSDDQNGIIAINGVLFFQMISLSFSNAIAVVTLFPGELPVFLKENRLGMYRTDAYFIARQVGELPWYFLATSIQATVVYWMAGLRGEFIRFIVYFAIAHLTTQCAISYGMMLSALASTASVATALAGPCVSTVMLFGGFFIKDETIPVYFLWLKLLSWVKYAFEMAQINQWNDFGSINCPANVTAACLSNGQAVLERSGYNPQNFSNCLLSLLGLLIGFRLIAFGIIFMKTYQRY